jgi:hypothetical protein
MSTNFPFLKLPRELRDFFYEYTAQREGLVRLTPTGSTTLLSSKSPFILSSHEIRNEYLQILREIALSNQNNIWLLAPVTNLNFNQAIAFITSLTTKELRNLNIKSNLHIDLIVTADSSPDFGSLEAWNKLVDLCGIEANYRIDRKRSSTFLPRSWKDVYCRKCSTCETGKVWRKVNEHYGSLNVTLYLPPGLQMPGAAVDGSRERDAAATSMGQAQVEEGIGNLWAGLDGLRITPASLE